MALSRPFLVVNPKSANGATGRRFGEIAQAVRGAIGEFEAGFTGRPWEACSMARAALKAGHDLVVAVGGDGTLNEVVNGFFEGGRPVAPEARLGLIPRGTGGDFRRTYGWGSGLDEAVRRLKGDSARRIDVGRIELVDGQGAPATRYFVNIASAGVSGLVDFEVNRSTKLWGGKVSFILGTLKAMKRYRDRRVRLSLDDRPGEVVDCTVVAVANGQYFGGGMWVAPDARPDDGLFDVTLWSGYGLSDFVTKAGAIYSGAHVKLPKTRRFHARRVRLESDEEVLLDVDGEQPGRLPATLELIPQSLWLKT